MTPRSRKPVMLPVTLMGSSDQTNTKRGTNSNSSLREEDEDEFNFDNMPSTSNRLSLYKSKSENDFTELLLLQDRDQKHALKSKILSEGSKISVLPTVEYLTSPFRYVFYLQYNILCV